MNIEQKLINWILKIFMIQLTTMKKLLCEKNRLSTQIGNIKLQIEKNNVSYERLQKEISELNTDIKSYEDNKEAIENLDGLHVLAKEMIKHMEEEA